MHWTDPSQALPSLEVLRAAMHERRRVRMRYRSQQQPEPVQRDVNPYTLVHSWGWQYCIGYCQQRRAIRSFRLDRIGVLAMLNQTFADVADFNLPASVATDPWFQRRLRAWLHFGSATALSALDNRAYWESCEQQEDSAVLVSFAAPDLEAAASIVLRYGFPATIMEPTALRELLRARASALAAQYAAAQCMKERNHGTEARDDRPTVYDRH